MLIALKSVLCRTC